MERLKNVCSGLYSDSMKALNHAFGGIGLWLILDELGIIQAIKFYFMGLGGSK